MTSVKRKGRHVVAVVLGGTSAGARDSRMRQLLAQHVDKASTRKTAPMIAEAPARDAPSPRTTAGTDRYEMASATNTPVREAPRGFAPAAGSDEPIRPVTVRTVSVKPPPKAAKATPPAAAPQPVAEAPPGTARAEAPPSPPPAPARAGILGVLTVPARTAYANETPTAAPAPTIVAARTEPVREAAPQREATPPAAAVPSSRPQTRSGWMIQVGAYPAESEAHERLAVVKTKASRLLASASPFTEAVQRGETTLYRARFAGFEREQAEAACKFLKRNDVDCLALRN